MSFVYLYIVASLAHEIKCQDMSVEGMIKRCVFDLEQSELLDCVHSVTYFKINPANHSFWWSIERSFSEFATQRALTNNDYPKLLVRGSKALLKL